PAAVPLRTARTVTAKEPRFAAPRRDGPGAFRGTPATSLQPPRLRAGAASVRQRVLRPTGPTAAAWPAALRFRASPVVRWSRAPAPGGRVLPSTPSAP